MRGIDTYLAERQWANVEGTIGPEVLSYLKIFSDLQVEAGLLGDVGEIGVFMGRFFIGMQCLSRPGEHALAIDVFTDDASNYDVTGGASSLDQFTANVKAYVSAEAQDRLRIVQKDSLFVRVDAIRREMATEGFRLLSIDGAHSWYHTASDLNLANVLTRPGGIVILDDVTNSGWPGVIDGLARFMLLTPDRRLQPFMMSYNKLWLTTPDHHDRYLNLAISDAVPRYAGQGKRVTEFFGARIVGF